MPIPITTDPPGDVGTSYSPFENQVTLPAGPIPLGTWIVSGAWTLNVAGGTNMTGTGGMIVSDGTNVTTAGGVAVKIR